MEAEVRKKSARWTWPIIIGILVAGWLALRFFGHLMVTFERNFQFGVWDTWLGYIGLLVGLVVAAAFNWPPLRSGIAGFVVGLALLIVINVLVPTPVPCLQSSKGWDILRAYSITCEPAR